MSEYVEVHGVSLKNQREKERQADLDHIRIAGHPDGTPESPRWVVSHHASADDRKPQEFVFDDGHEMLAHIANATSVPESVHEANDDLGRKVLPDELQNRSGRGR